MTTATTRFGQIPTEEESYAAGREARIGWDRPWEPGDPADHGRREPAMSPRITDTDLIALASLGEAQARRARDMPKGIGESALHRLRTLGLASCQNSKIGGYYTRLPEGTAILRNHAGRLSILWRSEKLNAGHLAELAAAGISVV